MLSSGEEREIEEYLAGLENSASVQAAVLTVPSLDGDSVEGYSIRVADEWKLGKADSDKGILILLAMEERAIRIEVGYGLEGELTDAKSGYIIREIMVPYFQKGDYGAGLFAGTKAVGGVVTAEADISSEKISESSGSRNTGRSSGSFNFLFVFFFIFFGVLRGLGRGLGRRRYYRGTGAGSLGRALFWGSVIGSASRRGGSRGGFGGGGFSGGGFSGGGGGFGGGGASGGW